MSRLNTLGTARNVCLGRKDCKDCPYDSLSGCLPITVNVSSITRVRQIIGPLNHEQAN